MEPILAQIEELFLDEKYTEALQLVNQKLTEYPNSIELVKAKVVILVQLNKFRPALLTLKKFSKLNTKTSSFKFAFEEGYCLYRLGKYQSALNTLEGSNEDRDLILQAQCLYRLESFQESVNLFEKLMERVSEDEDGLLRTNLLAAKAALSLSSNSKVTMSIGFESAAEKYNASLIAYGLKDYLGSADLAKKSNSMESSVNSQLVEAAALTADSETVKRAKSLYTTLQSQKLDKVQSAAVSVGLAICSSKTDYSIPKVDNLTVFNYQRKAFLQSQLAAHLQNQRPDEAKSLIARNPDYLTQFKTLTMEPIKGCNKSRMVDSMAFDKMVGVKQFEVAKCSLKSLIERGQLRESQALLEKYPNEQEFNNIRQVLSLLLPNSTTTSGLVDIEMVDSAELTAFKTEISSSSSSTRKVRSNQNRSKKSLKTGGSATVDSERWKPLRDRSYYKKNRKNPNWTTSILAPNSFRNPSPGSILDYKAPPAPAESFTKGYAYFRRDTRRAYPTTQTLITPTALKLPEGLNDEAKLEAEMPPVPGFRRKWRVAEEQPPASGYFPISNQQ